MQFFREVVVNAAINLVTVEVLASARDVVVDDIAKVRVRLGNEFENIGHRRRYWYQIWLSSGGDRFSPAAVHKPASRVEDHARLRRNRAPLRGRHELRVGARRCRGGPIGTNKV